jgi:hypothetical protein
MGQWSNGLRSQQEKSSYASVEHSSTHKPCIEHIADEKPRANAPAATGAAGDAKTVQCTENAIEALREVASKTPRRWP